MTQRIAFTTWTTVDLNDALQGLRDVVTIRGASFVYTPPVTDEGISDGICTYWDYEDDCPSCGIGLYLFSVLGVAPAYLKALDTVGKASSAFPEGCPVSINSDQAERILTAANVRFTAYAVDVLRDFQSFQDDARPYGVCLNGALDTAAYSRGE